jgi:hypothetical protein
MRARWLLIPLAVLLAGCDDNTTSVRDVTPPAAPRGVRTITGDQEVFIDWLANTEPDVAGYFVYAGSCASGSCAQRVGATTGTSLVVTGLANGVTRYFSVTAYDRAGHESDLSYEIVYDTPRPEGFGRVLSNYLDTSAGTGYDFSQYTTRAWDDTLTDMYFGYNGTFYQMFVPDFQTDIQDAGYATTLDAVDWAPASGWSPTGTVELIVGHCYVVWTRDDHFAKFRVTDLRPGASGSPARVTFDWAYQVAQGNPELRARKAKTGGWQPRPIAWAPNGG